MQPLDIFSAQPQERDAMLPAVCLPHYHVLNGKRIGVLREIDLERHF